MGMLLSLVGVSLATPFAAGCAALPFFGRPSPRTGFAGMLFHSIRPGSRAGFSHMRVDRFNGLLELMASAKISTITVRDAASDRVGEPAPTADSAAVMAFDDGFGDFYDLALPALRRHGFHATVFPVAGFVGSYSSWDVFPRLPHLSAAQIREVAALGHEIGSHTLTHADCTRLCKRDLDRELGDSKKGLEDIAGTDVTSLSFPCGRWNPRVWQRARELGYRAATVYTRVSQRRPGMVPLTAAYAFDTPQDLLARAGIAPHSAVSAARGWIMPHFAKGTPLFRWRKEYR